MDSVFDEKKEKLFDLRLKRNSEIYVENWLFYVNASIC